MRTATGAGIVAGVVVDRVRRIGFGPALAILGAAGVLATVIVGGLDRDLPPRSPAPSTSPVPTTTATSGAPVPTDPAGPRFPIVTRTAAELAGGRADLYVPLPGSAGRARERYPVAVLLADPRTDVNQYEQFAHDVGSYGVAVLVTTRRSDQVVREFEAWSASVERASEAYLNGLIAPSVSFVVAHDRAQPAATTWHTVRAAVLLTPAGDVALASTGERASLLLVCGEVSTATGRCAQSVPGASVVDIDGAVPLSVTDQGRRGARVFGDVTPVRLRTIAALAQATGLWLLAHNGDTIARAEVGRLIG